MSSVVLVGNPRVGSRTLAVASALARHLGAPSSRVIELADAVAIGFTADPVRPPSPQPDATAAVREAELLIVATPSYKGTYTGLLKVFLDRFAAGELAGVRAVPVAVAGSPAHADQTAADLARLLGELGADVTQPVALLESQLPDLDALAAEHAARLTVPTA